ncbi:hypothetical protein MDAP_002832 [Mitosporidium daphniae]
MVHTFQMVFNGLSMTSLFLTAVIIIIYLSNQKNDLLVFTGIVIFLIQGMMLMSSVFYSKNFSDHECYSGSYLCIIQAIFLNYATISLHALVACMMYHTWLQVISWKPSQYPSPKCVQSELHLGISSAGNGFCLKQWKQTANSIQFEANNNSPQSTKDGIKEDQNPGGVWKNLGKSASPYCVIKSFHSKDHGKFKKPRLGTLNQYLFISFLIPAFPTVLLVFFILGWGCHMKTIVQPFSCFCYISGTFWVKFFTFIGWCLAFSIPGLGFAFHLLYKMLFLREQSIQLGRTTYLTKVSISKIALSTFIYFLCVFSNLIPHIFFFPNDPEFPLNTSLLPTLSLSDMNPYANKYLCWWITPCSFKDIQNPTQMRQMFINSELSFFQDPRLAYYAYMRCPTISSLLPSLLGIVFFLMFGFGKHALSFYLKVFMNVKHAFCQAQEAVLKCNPLKLCRETFSKRS